MVIHQKRAIYQLQESWISVVCIGGLSWLLVSFWACVKYYHICWLFDWLVVTCLAQCTVTFLGSSLKWCTVYIQLISAHQACHVYCRFTGLLCEAVGSVDWTLHENIEVWVPSQRCCMESKLFVFNSSCCGVSLHFWFVFASFNPFGTGVFSPVDWVSLW